MSGSSINAVYCEQDNMVYIFLTDEEEHGIHLTGEQAVVFAYTIKEAAKNVQDDPQG